MQRIIIVKNDRVAGGHPGQSDLDDPSVIYESPARLEAALSAADFFISLRGQKVPIFEAPEVTQGQLLRMHSQAYLDSIDAALSSAQQSDSKTVDLGHEAFVAATSKPALLTAAGAGVFAVDAVLGGQAAHAFCVVRPPGHHAERERAMGYCVFANVGVAALHALATSNERVAVVDFDAHRGNWIESVDASAPSRERLLFCDLYIDGPGEYPYSAQTRALVDTPRIISVPLPAAIRGEEYLAKFRTTILPRLIEFKPGLILVSAGFDCLRDDPVGGFSLMPSHLHSIMGDLIRVCDRTVSILEGGYHLDHLGLGVIGHLLALDGRRSIGR